jgi:hypothetical protein
LGIYGRIILKYNLKELGCCLESAGSVVGLSECTLLSETERQCISWSGEQVSACKSHSCPSVPSYTCLFYKPTMFYSVNSATCFSILLKPSSGTIRIIILIISIAIK